MDADLYAVRRVCFGTVDAIPEVLRQDPRVSDVEKWAVRAPRLVVFVQGRLDMALILARPAWAAVRPERLAANLADLQDAVAGPYTQAAGRSVE